MSSRNNQSGFSIVEIVIALAVVVLIGFLGYTAFNRMQENQAANSSQADQQSPVANDVKTAPSINSTSDLNEAERTLDQTDPSGSNNTDANQLDNELSAF